MCPSQLTKKHLHFGTGSENFDRRRRTVESQRRD
jgi:hypothetical protein